MDPATTAVGVGALAALCAVVSHTGWPCNRRARLAEDEIRRLRKELRAERYAASHDSLTGLPNRRAFKANATPLVTAEDRSPLLGMLIDLDDFKHVNDTLGHAAGDEVLVVLAGRIADWAGDGLVARLSGDEFVVLLAVGGQWDDRADDAMAERLGREIAAPIRVAEHSVRVTASIGVTRIDGPAPLSEILARADAAMYRAKAGRERAAVINPCWEPYAAAVKELPAPPSTSYRDTIHDLHRDTTHDLHRDPSHDLHRDSAVRHSARAGARASVQVHTFAGSTADTLRWESTR